MEAVPHPAELLAAWEDGERDERLVEMRRRLWGDRLDAFAECPACGERLELTIDAGALGRAPATATLTATAGDAEVRFRLPDSTDLAAAAACEDPGRRRRVLARRCVEAGPDGELSEELLTAMAARMAEVAGPADVTVAVTCPGCENEWEEALDVPAFVWQELSAAVRRLLGEVDALARAYGWSEAAVLALSARRRCHYVELACA